MAGRLRFYTLRLQKVYVLVHAENADGLKFIIIAIITFEMKKVKTKY